MLHIRVFGLFVYFVWPVFFESQLLTISHYTVQTTLGHAGSSLMLSGRDPRWEVGTLAGEHPEPSLRPHWPVGEFTDMQGLRSLPPHLLG